MKTGWHVLLCLLLTNQSLLGNRAQELAAQFFNIVAAGLLLVTAKDNREQKVAAATALIASMSTMTQAALEEEPNNDQPTRNSAQSDFIEELHRELLNGIEQDQDLKNLVETYTLIYELNRKPEPQNEPAQID